MMYIPILRTRKYCSIYMLILPLMLTSRTQSVEEGVALLLYKYAPLFLSHFVYCFVILLMPFNRLPINPYRQYTDARAAELCKIDGRRGC